MGKEVWFDNLMVGLYKGEVVEENHYYPFGLTLNTSQAQNVTGNSYKYQGIELEKHFGLETYETPNRGLDPQLGRFNSVDPLAEGTYDYSPYASMDNNPVSKTDPLGLSTEGEDDDDRQDGKGIITSSSSYFWRTNPWGAFWHDVSWAALEVSGVNAIDNFVADRANPANNTPRKIIEGTLEVGMATTRGEHIGGGPKEMKVVEPKVLDVVKATTRTEKSSSTSTTKRSSNKLTPDPKAIGDHTTFERDNNGKVYKYETYQKTSSGHNNPVKRYDGGQKDGRPGAPHKGVPTPHVQGKNIEVRPARAHEIPVNH